MDMRHPLSHPDHGCIAEPTPHLQGRFAVLNRRLIEVVRACGEVRFSDITVRPVICHVLSPGTQEATGPHRHPFTELTWVEGVPVDYQQGRQRIRVAPGMLFFMPAMMRHAWEVRHDGSRLHGFMVSVQAGSGGPSLCLEAAAAVVGYRLETTHELRSALRAMERHALDSAPGSVVVAAGYMRAALGLVLQASGLLHAASPSGGGVSLAATGDQAFLKGRDYLVTHLHRDTPLSEVAAAAGVTTRHLNRLFVQHLGVPAGAFQRRTRIDRARHLLHEPGVTVKAVAYDCGFADPACFARAFRRQVGLSPAAYVRSQA